MMRDIETERLVLRKFTMDDVDEYVRIFTRPELGEFPYGRALTPHEALWSIEQKLSFEKGSITPWAAVIKETNQLIGWIGLSFADCRCCRTARCPLRRHNYYISWRSWGCAACCVRD